MRAIPWNFDLAAPMNALSYPQPAWSRTSGYSLGAQQISQRNDHRPGLSIVSSISDLRAGDAPHPTGVPIVSQPLFAGCKYGPRPRAPKRRRGDKAALRQAACQCAIDDIAKLCFRL